MYLYRAGQHPEAFLEVVTVGRRPATRRNEHVEHREAAVGLLTREQHGVGVADNREVDERLVVGTRDRELARWIICCQRRRGSHRRIAHASARTTPVATSSDAVRPWTPIAVARFPRLVRTIRASAVGVIAAATSTQPSVVRPAAAKATSGTTPEVMSRTPLISVRPRRLSAAIPKSRVAWRG